jgi:hypothetical protein
MGIGPSHNPTPDIELFRCRGFFMENQHAKELPTFMAGVAAMQITIVPHLGEDAMQLVAFSLDDEDVLFEPQDDLDPLAILCALEDEAQDQPY